MTDHRERIERSADRIRGELLETLQELDRRRQHAMDWQDQLQRHAVLLAAVGATGVLALVGGILIHRARADVRRRKLRQERVRGFLRAWQHPKQLANQREGKPLPAELARKVALALGTALATQLARRTAVSVLPERQSRREEQLATL